MTIPATLRAGDSAAWSYEDTDHSAADGWVHEYVLAGPAKFSISVTGTDASFSVSIPFSTSSSWSAGRYTWSLRATRGTDERVTLESGATDILPNLDDLADPFDARTPARRLLDAIEATLENRATDDAQMLSIKGRTIQKTPMSDLIVLRDKYAAIVLREEQASGLAPKRNRIYTVFSR